METLAISAPWAPGIPSRTRLPAVLLILASIGYVVLVIFTATMVLSRFPQGLDAMTPHQMASFRPQYIVFHILALATGASGAAGLALLAAALRETRARIWASVALVVTLLTISLALVLFLGRLSLLSFTDATLGQNSTWRWTTWAFSNVSPPALAVATLAACVALFHSAMLRRTGLIVALLSAVVLILTIAGFPPFVFACLWLPLGIGLLRRRMPAAPR